MNESTDGCPGTNRHGEPCGHPAGWGTDRDEGPCKFHGGAADNRGEANGNYEHGGYSKYLADYLTDEEHDRAQAVFEDLDDAATVQDVGRAVATDLWIRYQRTGDTRFMREFRQVCDTFGLTPEDVLQVEHSGEVDHNHDLDDQQRSHLDAITQGPADVAVEAVEELPEEEP